MADTSFYNISDKTVRLCDRFTNNSLSKITFRKKKTNIIPLLSLTSSGCSIEKDIVNVENPNENPASDRNKLTLSASVDHLCTKDNTSGYYKSKHNFYETSSRNQKMEFIPENKETELNRSVDKLSDEVDVMDSEILGNKCEIKVKKRKKSKGGIFFDLEDDYNSGATDFSYSVESQKNKGINNRKRQRKSESLVDELNRCVYRSSMEPLDESKVVEKNCDTLDNTIHMNIKEENSIEMPALENISSRKKEKRKRKLTKEIILNSPKEELLETYKSVKNKIEDMPTESIYESSTCLKKNKTTRIPINEESYSNSVESESLKDYNNLIELSQLGEEGTVLQINNKKAKKKHKHKNKPDANSVAKNKIHHKETKIGSLNEDEKCKKLSNSDDEITNFTDSLIIANNSEKNYNKSIDHFSAPGTVANNISDQNVSRDLISFLLDKEGSKFIDKGLCNKHVSRNDKNKMKTKSSSKIALDKEKHIGKRTSGNDAQLSATRPKIVDTDEKDSNNSNLKHESKSHKPLNSDIDHIRKKLMKAALKNIQKTKIHKRSAHKNVKVKGNHSLELNSGDKPNRSIREKKLVFHNTDKKRKKKKKINKINDLTEMLISKVLNEREKSSNSHISRIEMKTVDNPKLNKLVDPSYTRDKHDVELKKKKSKSLVPSKTDIKKIQQSLIDAAFKERNLNMGQSKDLKGNQVQNSSAQHTLHKKV